LGRYTYSKSGGEPLVASLVEARGGEELRVGSIWLARRRHRSCSSTVPHEHRSSMQLRRTVDFLPPCPASHPTSPSVMSFPSQSSSRFSAESCNVQKEKRIGLTLCVWPGPHGHWLPSAASPTRPGSSLRYLGKAVAAMLKASGNPFSKLGRRSPLLGKTAWRRKCHR
jgi:hypothetical protein